MSEDLQNLRLKYSGQDIFTIESVAGGDKQLKFDSEKLHNEILYIMHKYGLNKLEATCK